MATIFLSKLFKKEKSNLVVLVAPQFECNCEYVTCQLKCSLPWPVAWSYSLELRSVAFSQEQTCVSSPVLYKCSFLHIMAHTKRFEALIETILMA